MCSTLSPPRLPSEKRGFFYTLYTFGKRERGIVFSFFGKTDSGFNCWMVFFKLHFTRRVGVTWNRKGETARHFQTVVRERDHCERDSAGSWCRWLGQKIYRKSRVCLWVSESDIVINQHQVNANSWSPHTQGLHKAPPPGGSSCSFFMSCWYRCCRIPLALSLARLITPPDHQHHTHTHTHTHLHRHTT